MELHDSSVKPAEDRVDATLNETAQTPVADAENTVEETVVAVEAQPAPASELPTKEAVMDALKALSELDAKEISNDEISRLKQQFYQLRSEEHRAEKELFLSRGNAEADFVASTDPAEEEFKNLLNVIKTKKAEYRAAIEAEQQHNYELKKAIVDKLVEMSNDADNVNRLFPQARDLQAEFKTIGEVPAPLSSDLWKQYQEACERFYDQLKINKELRDYDFKKNLGEKELLIAEAEKLLEEPDVVTAFRRLQTLHEKWREIGPVPKEVREEVWNRFKDISARINKLYQAHFEERKNRERENEEAKTAICERVEGYDFSGLTTYSAWDDMTRLILQAQEDWKKIGFASRKNNNTLFARFRATCDKFFAAKAEFFKQMKESLATNLEKKIALCERAEALRESTDWRKTSDELAALQQEWKQIGAVAKKHSEQVWRRFLAACDYFFDRKKKNTSGARKAEHENLALKKQIIEELKAIDTEKLSRNEAMKTLKDLQARWQQVGHVPFAEKDNVYKEYRAVVDELYGKLDTRESKSRMASFENTISEIGNDQQRLYRERERLLRFYEQKKGELQTYENNLLFFNAKSKTGDSMLRDMQRRIQRIKDDLADLENKIKVIDSKL